MSKKYDFEQIFQHGRQIKTQGMVFYYKVNNLNQLRISVIISKKTEKSAVKRNRLRRQIKEIIRTAAINRAIDLVFIVRKELFSDKFSRIKDKIHKLMPTALI
ncbi:MAG: ribonuclease P protein component [Candidatus Omnitrophota bacterium]